MTELQIRIDERQRIMALIENMYQKFKSDRKQLASKITDSTPNLIKLDHLYQGGQRCCLLLNALIGDKASQEMQQDNISSMIDSSQP